MYLANELRAQILRKGFTQKKLAEMLGITEKTMSLKINSGAFSITEASEISRILEIDHPESIFFGIE